MVYPSELARIARVEPVVPPAPAMFSMIICWPRARDMCSLTMRAVTSVPPPAGNGTIIVIGRDGYICAVAIAMPPAARQRPRPDAETAFGGEVSRPSSQEVAKGLAGHQSFSSVRSDRMTAVGTHSGH